MTDIREFPAARDRFTRWVRDALDALETDLASEGRSLHRKARAGLEQRISELTRDAEREFGYRPMSVTFPDSFHALSDADQAAIVAAVGEAMTTEAQRAFKWYATRYLQLAVKLEVELIKRHSGQ